MSGHPLALVPFSAAHFRVLQSWFAGERDLVLWGGPAMRWPLDEAQLQAMVDETRSDPPARQAWMAIDADGQFAGHAQIVIEWRHGNVTVGRFAVAPSHRGQGLAGALMGLVLEQAFALSGVERVELNVYAFNTPAIRTYERAGFRHEGVRRSSVRVDGERWDTVMMAQLRTEYQTAHPALGALRPGTVGDVESI